ncbi:MAG: RluA family pseudouridine synthase [Verrucomicrobiota bacterium]
MHPPSAAPRKAPKRPSTPGWTPVIVEESDDWIVIDKPSPMAAHPSKPGDNGTLWHYLSDLLAYECVNGGQISIITRLDRETSGLTLVAKTQAQARSFCRQMEARTIHKSYLALVWGWPQQDVWEIDGPLGRLGATTHSKIWLKQAILKEGAPAITRFEVVQRFSRPSSNGSEFSLIRAIPQTGRMHQIRVHLQASGHSILGDKIYGPDQECYLEFIETGWSSALEEQLLLPRHALHAEHLLLKESGLSWTAPLPKDMAAFIGNYSPIFSKT